MDIKEQLKANYTKIKRKRFFLYTDKYTVFSYVDSEGYNISNTNHAHVGYCPCCGKMNFAKDFYTLKENENFPEDWIKEKSTLPGGYRCNNIEHLLVKTEDNQIKLTCPDCKEDITNYERWYLKCGSDYFYDNWILDAYSYFVDKENEKISFTLFFITLFPNTKAGKLAVTNYNFKIVFNMKTHQSYILEIRNTDGKKVRPKWVTGSRIKNVTYSGFSCCNNIVTNCLRNNQVLKKMFEVIMSYNNRTWDDLLFDDYSLNDVFQNECSPWWGKNEKRIEADFGLLTIYHRFCKLGFNRCFYNSIKDLLMKYNTNGNKSDWRKIQKILLTISKSDNIIDAVESLIKKYKIPQKKKIRKLIYKNPLAIFDYLSIIKFNFTDYNIIMELLENYADIINYIKNNSHGDFNLVERFLNDMINLKGEPVVKNMIISMSSNINKESSNLIDAARMYCRIKEQKDVNPKSLRGTIKEIHDNLVLDYKKIRIENKAIEYNEEELKLNETIDGFKFVLARDTHQLIDVGNDMGICVGSYGDNAYKKHLIIVIMMQNNKYVGCIELSGDGKRLKQAKAKYNNLLQEYKAVSLKKWIESKEIDGTNCYDYRHIIEDNISFDENEIYQSSHNYANYGMPFF